MGPSAADRLEAGSPAGASWIGLPGQSLLSLTGEERLEFLQSLLTQDLRVPPGRTLPSALADRKGGWTADLWLHVAANEVFLTARRSSFETIVEALERHLFSSRVAWSEPLGPAPAAFLVFGPGAVAAAARLGLQFASGGTEGGRLDVAGLAGVWFRLREVSPADFLFLVPATEEPRFRRRLESIDPPLAEAGEERFHLARIAAGTPWHGVDGDREVLVPEVVPPDRVSLDKGCFLGQETIARIRHRGRLRERLLRVWIAGPAPAPGSSILDPAGETIGRITSAAPLPGGGALALAYRRESASGREASLAGGGRVEWLESDRPLERGGRPEATPGEAGVGPA